MRLLSHVLSRSPSFPRSPVHWIPSNGREAFRADVLLGLSKAQKTIPSKYFYDAEGSRLFEEICEQEEYYPTRVESRILRDHAEEMALLIGEQAVVIEPGAGSAEKIRFLLARLIEPALYQPIEISRTALEEAVVSLRRAFPLLRLNPVCGDYADRETMRVPDGAEHGGKRVIFFPGSTIGNLDPDDARKLLRELAAVVRGPRPGLILAGVDTRKQADVLDRAYNDAAGVTARFNLNLLARINRELDADFDLSAFKHRAFYRPERRRIEMHLVSVRDQVVHVSGVEFSFREGETIHTESSYKYAPDEFQTIARSAGLLPLRCWTDAEGTFSIHCLGAGIH